MKEFFVAWVFAVKHYRVFRARKRPRSDEEILKTGYKPCDRWIQPWWYRAIMFFPITVSFAFRMRNNRNYKIIENWDNYWERKSEYIHENDIVKILYNEDTPKQYIGKIGTVGKVDKDTGEFSIIFKNKYGIAIGQYVPKFVLKVKRLGYYNAIAPDLYSYVNK